MSTPPLNPTTFRFPFDIEGNAHDSVVSAIRYCFSGLLDINQAIPHLKSQLDSTATVANSASSSSSFGVSDFNSATGSIVYFPQFGTVNNQLGNASYETQQSDNGAKIIVGDSSAVAVTLSNSVTAPWFTIIDNDSSAIATLSPGVGSSLFGEQTISPGGFGIIFYDGSDFWCGAAASVQPDEVTIGIDSGVIFTQVYADSGAPGFVPDTPGNPFYFDSSMSPWQGNVWQDGQWNLFGNGGGASGLTQLTGDVLAGPGTGSQAATVVDTHLSAPLPVAQGGTGTASPGLVAGSNITITGSWPNQTVNSTGGSGPNFADDETVSGSGTSWTLAHTPSPSASLQLFQEIAGFGGVLLRQGTDYTLTGAAVTTTNSLTAGVLFAWYRY